MANDWEVVKSNDGWEPVGQANSPETAMAGFIKNFKTPLQYGAGLTQGASPSDLPYVLAKTISGYSFGQPEVAARNPISGVIGSNMALGMRMVGATPPKEPSVMPEAVTPKGQFLGDVSGLLAGMTAPIQTGREAIAETAIGKNWANAGKNEVPFLRKVINNLWEGRKKLSTDFGAGLDKIMATKPNVQVNVAPPIAQAKALEANGWLSDKVKNLIEKSPLVKEIFNSKQPASAFIGRSAKEAQAMLNELTSAMSSSKLAGKGIRPTDRAALDFIDSFRTAISDAFPEEMGAMRDAYKNGINNFNSLKTALSERSIQNTLKVGIKNPLTKDAAKNFLSPEIMKEILGYAKAKGAMGFGSRVGAAIPSAIGHALVYAPAYGLVHKLLGGGNAQESGVE